MSPRGTLVSPMRPQTLLCMCAHYVISRDHSRKLAFATYFGKVAFTPPKPSGSDAAETFRQFLADNRATRFPSDVEIARPDEGGEFLERAFGALCSKYNITQEFTSASSPQFNCVAERALGLIEAAALVQEYKLRYYFRTSSFLLPILYGRRPCRGRAILLIALQRPPTQTANPRTRSGMAAHPGVICCHSSSLAITKPSERTSRSPKRKSVSI